MEINVFMTIFIVVFLILPGLFCFVKLVSLCHSEINNARESGNNDGRHARRNDVYSISANLGPNDPANNYQDYFWDVSPQASRSRTELAKYDKDLPSYEDVMQMEMRQQVLGSAASGTGTPAIVPVTALTAALPVSQSSVTASTV